MHVVRRIGVGTDPGSAPTITPPTMTTSCMATRLAAWWPADQSPTRNSHGPRSWTARPGKGSTNASMRRVSVRARSGGAGAKRISWRLVPGLAPPEPWPEAT